ncbi:hypothetical protein HBI24_215620 [Parastagonospora nodorum]|nr:hypothetical protein HBH53_196180 [Parastagonospora nodorum]KAH3966834.1 hypothetical protein HBH52_195970 [Parastagonospora nodorum]KAH4115215.1 hypothetical protein HBH47_183850 [Parastagonospora nodorum]KAH4184387.1 hypothetical protein HBH42_189230 [Parastagonospora nodorum]KAH4801270.1 hypothetical protein HBH61_198200 [Parastagonospora nodorum]
MSEETQVAIVGAGPAGLTLGLCLARQQIKSVILEKGSDITSDPRGVYLSGDAVRILHSLGLGPDLETIGHVNKSVNFHRTTISGKPFKTLHTWSDALNQVLPNGILQIQPRLETSLRHQIEASSYCTLRSGCEVINRVAEEPPVITYRTKDGHEHDIKAQWLIGADGKTGVVRKRFLEASAGIRQEEGAHRYSGTWIAANLKLKLPTPQTHPSFPLWNFGYTPEKVYDLYWPEGWHFCSPPGKPTATGRFGPYEERLWRHEFRQDDWNDNMDATELLWEHLGPMITRERDEKGISFSQQVQYPKDCIEIIRCRPYHFVHKVVNKWFSGKTILIGDAAHIFPPFAGQGIASGIRDAHQLSWQLALLLKNPSMPPKVANAALEAWEAERIKSVNDAAFLSLLNGQLCNDQPTFWMLALLRIIDFLSLIPYLGLRLDIQVVKECEGFTNVDHGFLIKGHRGGCRLAQIVVQSHRQGLMLSDQMLQSNQNGLRLLVISNGNHHKHYMEAKTAVNEASLSPAVISAESILIFSPAPVDTSQEDLKSLESYMELFWPADDWISVAGDKPGYDRSSFIDRLGTNTRFAVIRPDFFVYACAKDIGELKKCLHTLRTRLS